jgi:antitoxin MazE
MQKEAKLVQIGNSQGIRLPKILISKYGFGEKIILEELPEGILIRPESGGKLSWEETYKAMAEEQEEWQDWAELDIDLESNL